MSAQELAEEIERLILSTTDVFASQVERLQGSVYNRILASVQGLEVDSDGYILQNAANRKILYEAENLIDDLLPGESLTKIVSESLTIIPQLEAVSGDYFLGISESFNPNRNFVRSLQLRTIESIEANLLQDGLTASIKLPLKDILNQNINSGGSLSGFHQQLRNFIKGEEDLDGRLLSYSRTYLRDTLFSYSRAYQQAMTADLKLSYYMYAGGVMDKTRDFCAERVGNFYHESEIKKWASLEWQGKARNTTESSIFTLCGGYNCAHSLIPVSKKIVPRSHLLI
jgi:hypothetical protein